MTETPTTAAVDPATVDALWTPIRVGALHLPHRLAMAPMTRSRALPDGTPTELNATYYAQRASMALEITEGTQPSEDGQGYVFTPGVHTDNHVTGWRTVTDAVHDAGGRIVVQLMHVGRVSHPANTPHGRQPVAPSALAPTDSMFTLEGMQDIPTPRELTTAEVADVVAEFRHAARTAIDAGADGVEIHGANGYLVQQFLAASSNQRTDRYGGSVENRIRFAVEVATAVADEIGAERTGIRISPGLPLYGIVEDDRDEVYPALVAALAPLGLAYLHVVWADPDDDTLLRTLRAGWPHALLLNRAGAPITRRVQDITDGVADVVTVAALSLANPDLVARLHEGAPLNEPDKATYYGGDEHGYTDYPTFQDDRS